MEKWLHTRLKFANLEDADFTQAILRNADLEGANLRGTILHGADLSNAQNLTVEQIRAAKTDANTKLPYYLAV